MRNNLRMTAALLVVVGAVLGTAIGISLVGASAGDSADKYDVTVRFNASVTQDDIDDTGALLRTYDDDLDFVILESFPPMGRAVIEVEAGDFCQTIEAELETAGYIEETTCQPWTGNVRADPDDTISTDNDAN